MKNFISPVVSKRRWKAVGVCLLSLTLVGGCGKPAGSAPVEVVEAPKENPPPESRTPTVPESRPAPKTTEPKTAEPKKDESKTPQPKEPVQPETPTVAGKPFAFPNDRGGKILENFLPPKLAAMKPERVEIIPKERVLPEFLNSATAGLPAAADAPPILRLPSRKEFQPTTLPEKIVSDFGLATPPLPPMTEPEVGSLHKQPTRDPSRPADLPFLASKPVADRAPLDDPTVEFTAQSVVSLLLPLREAMAPFMKLAIAEPFENAGKTAAKPAVVEDPNKVLTPPPAPKP